MSGRCPAFLVATYGAILNSQKGVIFMDPVPDINFEFCCILFLDRNGGNDPLMDFFHSWFSDFSELMLDLVFEYRYDSLLGTVYVLKKSN